MSIRNGRSTRQGRALQKLVAAGAADLVIAVQAGELTAEAAYERFLAQKGKQRR